MLSQKLGDTALTAAARLGHEAVVKLLLQRGASAEHAVRASQGHRCLLCNRSRFLYLCRIIRGLQRYAWRLITKELLARLFCFRHTCSVAETTRYAAFTSPSGAVHDLIIASRIPVQNFHRTLVVD